MKPMRMEELQFTASIIILIDHFISFEGFTELNLLDYFHN